MNTRERFDATMNYTLPDRPLLKPLCFQPYVLEALFKDMGITTLDEFQLRVGEDFRHISPLYTGPEMKRYEDGSYDSLWGERYKRLPFGNGTYEEPVFQPFKDIETLSEVEKMRFPSPDWFDYSNVKQQCEENGDYIRFVGNAGVLDFMNGIGFMRGIERVYLDVGLEDEVYLYIAEKRYEFFMEHIRRILEAADGAIDVVYCGEDLGTQIAPIINPAAFMKLFAPKYKALFELAHSYGAKTMMHSCGSIRTFLPILIDLGLDILEGVQVDAANMDIVSLHEEFYRKVVFCGSLSVQSLLCKGTPEDIYREVDLRLRLFKEGGLMLGPTNCLQSDMPLENFYAMCKATGSMK